MRKLLLFFIFLTACSSKITTDGGEENIGNTMINVINKKLSITQFDSLCVADTLPSNLEYWRFLGVKDYESGEKVSLYMYLKFNGKNETTYRAEDTKDDSIKITKRLIK